MNIEIEETTSLKNSYDFKNKMFIHSKYFTLLKLCGKADNNLRSSE